MYILISNFLSYKENLNKVANTIQHWHFLNYNVLDHQLKLLILEGRELNIMKLIIISKKKCNDFILHFSFMLYYLINSDSDNKSIIKIIIIHICTKVQQIRGVFFKIKVKYTTRTTNQSPLSMLLLCYFTLLTRRQIKIYNINQTTNNVCIFLSLIN